MVGCINLWHGLRGIIIGARFDPIQLFFEEEVVLVKRGQFFP